MSAIIHQSLPRDYIINLELTSSKKFKPVPYVLFIRALTATYGSNHVEKAIESYVDDAEKVRYVGGCEIAEKAKKMSDVDSTELLSVAMQKYMAELTRRMALA